MKYLKVAEARARFGEILDEAEKGAPVIIERRGIRFRLLAEAQSMKPAAAASPFEFVDDAVVSGQWTWKIEPKGAVFAAPRKRR